MCRLPSHLLSVPPFRMARFPPLSTVRLAPLTLLADDRLDAPLPWDHIDTGIAKWWLKTDLQVGCWRMLPSRRGAALSLQAGAQSQPALGRSWAGQVGLWMGRDCDRAGALRTAAGYRHGCKVGCHSTHASCTFSFPPSAARTGGGHGPRLQPLGCAAPAWGVTTAIKRAGMARARVTAGNKRAPCPPAARALWASQSPPTCIASNNLHLPAVLPSLPAGICTECGVCDDEEEAAQEGGRDGSSASRGFGRNVVYEPPPIPEFEGHYRPNSTRAQRLRFRCAPAADGSPEPSWWPAVGT